MEGYAKENITFYIRKVWNNAYKKILFINNYKTLSQQIVVLEIIAATQKKGNRVSNKKLDE